MVERMEDKKSCCPCPGKEAQQKELRYQICNMLIAWSRPSW
ncbi:hypothetical protein UF75_2290 [Desulfosporosinus sp. I2]|nr:hypothetical protein UF75_2290 [Desulfosporosinus sp. I2]